jgi:predicted outer membrane repeat protein
MTRDRSTSRRAVRSAVAAIVLAGAAVAGSVVFTSVTGSDDRAEAVTFSVDTLTASDDAAPGDQLCADAGGGCSLRAAIQEAEALTGDHEIVVATGTHDLGGPITIRSRLSLTRDWYGGASANPVIDLADGPGLRVEGGSLSMSGIDMINGLDPDGVGGAAIHGVGAEITVSDGVFRNNRTDGFGGAIFVSTGTLNAVARFEENAALGGGAIAVIGTDLLILGAEFTANGASGSGGAVHAVQPSRLSVSSSTFTDNVALDQGGAIFVEGHGAGGPFESNQATYEGNTAGNEGGALFVGAPSISDATFRVWRSTFTANGALVGGAVASDLARVQVEQSTFDGNQSVGGAGGAIGGGGPLVVSASDFTDNRADGNGGAIGSNAVLEMTGSDFTGNEATGFGGALATFSESTPSITGGSMTGNEGGEGAGAIWRIGSEPTLDGVDIDGNTPVDDQVFVADPTDDGEDPPPSTTIPPSTTAPPTTAPPTTSPPTTSPPTTAPPTTSPPTTSPPTTTPATGRFVPIAPERLHDTRSGSPVVAGQERRFKITGGAIPSNATAVVLNVTATQSQASGWLQVMPTGRATPGSSSTLNLDLGGQTIPNAAIAPLGNGGQISIYSTFNTDVLIDVFGYFVPAASSKAGRLMPLQPKRILDTRVGLGWTPPAAPPPVGPPGPGAPANPGDTKNCTDFGSYAAAKAWFDTYFPFYGDIAGLDQDGDRIPCESLPGAPLLAQALVPDRSVISLQVAGKGGVPRSGVSAVVLNVTAVDPTAAGWVQVAPTPVTKGTHSNLNPEPGRTIANLVIVPLGSGGRVDLYTELYQPGTLDLLADVVGYFTDASASNADAGLFVPIRPERNIDTRLPAPQPEVPSGGIVDTNVRAVAPGAVAIAGNLTSTGGDAGGWLQLAATPLTPGASSSLNTSYADQTIANAVLSPVTSRGAAQVYSYGATHVLLDITGYFTG